MDDVLAVLLWVALFYVCINRNNYKVVFSSVLRCIMTIVFFKERHKMWTRN